MNNNLFLINSPLDQFEIRDLISINIPVLSNLNLSLTNISLYLIIGFSIILTLSLINNNFNRLVTNNWSLFQESIYATLYSIVVNQINKKNGQMYFPFIYGLFMFILVNNLLGMIPYSFASTSHFVLTFALSFTIVIGSTILESLNYYSLKALIIIRSSLL